MTQDALARYRASKLIRDVRLQREAEAAEVDLPEEDCEDCPPPVTAASPNDILISGVAVPYDTPTGDGRGVQAGALTWDLEEEGVPIIWDREDGDHSGMVLGRVDSFMDDGGAVLAEARLFDTEDPIAQAAVARVEELIAEGALGWSVMLDDEEVVATYKEPEVTEATDGTVTVRYKTSDQMQWTVAARIRHLALVDTPAWPSARPVLGPLPVNASVALMSTYPALHFDKWDSVDPVPLQVTADGRVFGHAAGDGCYRNGSKAKCDRYSKDPDPAMRNFHTGTVTLDNGNAIRAGSLTCDSLHASISMSHNQQRQHHENTSTVWARVVAWNDKRGRLCISGSVVPGLDPEFLGRVAGLPLSVETWPVPGITGLTLVAAHTVVTPAWPVT